MRLAVLSALLPEEITPEFGGLLLGTPRRFVAVPRGLFVGRADTSSLRALRFGLRRPPASAPSCSPLLRTKEGDPPAGSRLG